MSCASGVTSALSNAKKIRSPAVAARSCCDPGPNRAAAIPPGAPRATGPPGPPRPPGPPSAVSGRLPQAASISKAPTRAVNRRSMLSPFKTCGEKRRRLWSRLLSEARLTKSRLAKPRLTKQWRPGRIGRAPGRIDDTLVLPGEIDRIELRIAAAPTRIGAALAEIHQHAPVRRPGWPLDEIILRQQPFAGTVRPHHADVERPALDL